MKKIFSALAVAALAVYFLYFAIPALGTGFARDDPMNAGEYWIRGFWRSVADVATFWSTAYRPLGAMFYLPLYHVFGFSPIPFRVAVMALIAVNIVLTWLVADLLTGSKAAAALAAMLVTAHASMGAIYFNTSMIYDILAYLFTALMLLLYLKFRGAGELSVAQSAAVICAFIAALDSKELAVVASGWVLAYELLFHRPPRLRLPIILCGISIVYTLGKFLGPNPLDKQEGYLLEITWHRYFWNNRYYLNDLFYSHFFSTSRRLVLAWLALTAICVIVRRREVWWSWFLVSTATLGVSFTMQPRGGSGLYIPLFAWALFASALLVGGLQRWPALEWTAAVAIAVFAARYTVPYWHGQPKLYTDDHRPTTVAMAEMRALPKPAPRSRVIFLNDPFPNGYDILFIAQLLWNDHTLDIDLGNKFTKPPDLDQYQWVVAFEGEKLHVLKQPQPDRPSDPPAR